MQRIWDARGLKPHRVETFKLSNDPQFEDKLIEVVALYLNPPKKAVVLCMDEKSQIQALDRTQPSLPMTKGRAGTMAHDYKRNGTATLFAALDVPPALCSANAYPKVPARRVPGLLAHHRRDVPKALQVHLILANYPKPLIWTASAESILEKIRRERVVHNQSTKLRHTTRVRFPREPGRGEDHAGRVGGAACPPNCATTIP